MVISFFVFSLLLRKKGEKNKKYIAVKQLFFFHSLNFKLTLKKGFHNRVSIPFIRNSPGGWKSFHFIMIGWYPLIKKRINYLSCIEVKGQLIFYHDNLLLKIKHFVEKKYFKCYRLIKGNYFLKKHSEAWSLKA